LPIRNDQRRQFRFPASNQLPRARLRAIEHFMMLDVGDKRIA
jgi:hypothetical protein